MILRCAMSLVSLTFALSATGFEMPSKAANVRFDEGSNVLTQKGREDLDNLLNWARLPMHCPVGSAYVVSYLSDSDAINPEFSSLMAARSIAVRKYLMQNGLYASAELHIYPTLPKLPSDPRGVVGVEAHASGFGGSC